MSKRKIIAIYLGDFRFPKEPMGKFFFDYDEPNKRFVLRGCQEIKYDLSTVIEDNDFILFEHIEHETGNPIDDEMNQLDKNDFFGRNLMFNDLYQEFIDEEMKNYKEGKQDLGRTSSCIGGYTRALQDMKEFNSETSLIFQKTIMDLLDEISVNTTKMRTDRYTR